MANRRGGPLPGNKGVPNNSGGRRITGSLSETRKLSESEKMGQINGPKQKKVGGISSKTKKVGRG